METFADYILSEKEFTKKLEIVYYLKKKKGIFFDKSVILKAQIAKLFIEMMNLDVDENLVLTACLLYACKKNNVVRDLNGVKRYALDGAEYLQTLGFSDRFCKICTEVNRYFEDPEIPREKEGDILELVDNFGGLVLDRPERKGYPIDEAMNLIENRNLKDKHNIYLEKFKKFMYMKEGVAA